MTMDNDELVTLATAGKFIPYPEHVANILILDWNIGPDAGVVATGGLAHLIANETKSIRRVEPFLTLEGLRLIWERNREPAP